MIQTQTSYNHSTNLAYSDTIIAETCVKYATYHPTSLIHPPTTWPPLATLMVPEKGTM
ncbi:uncharacterized protein BDR25DRAFT_305663 [Lindgomyces ingoldianus]|uniref:Uncharacterized protein n=1 Tax=Lindgomyces ingoldianus TaxID=673940 RepID=A0ACB6QL31_9PLEO|nr:uncharacterized protein BDR25DRAFT_305663 [Lindgomyces ingoldianus]KAF2467230.1 hypothetical protein BDR25DRAFT_305663 [Lindgomyces ingoldianus]